MENAAKALEIAAGVLLAVMIVAVIAWFFSTISLWPQEEDDLETVEQLTKFNLEYEVYDKSAMYGVDVISCLNKAQSNNEKYAEGGSFLTGNRYGKEYYIQVKVTINSDLEESLEVYYYNASNQLTQRFDNAASEYTMGSAGFNFTDSGDIFYTGFDKNTVLGPTTNVLSGPGYLEPGVVANLYDENNLNSKTPLQTLIALSSSYMKQSVTNTSGKNLDQWASATWSTALYDLKTRKFKCDYITYSSKTGRVNEISFSEI